MSEASDKDSSACPVDHKSRAAWLEKAGAAGGQPPHPLPAAVAAAADEESSSKRKTRPLALDRETSTIPRAPISPPTSTPNPSSRPSRPPSNHEQESAPSGTGNWIYPSEKMFFDAMRRKQYDPRATDMAAVVPIHNAVNERAWQEIRAWEARFAWARRANARCGGPRLASFSGDSSRLTPRARLNCLLGYQAPFDRHDWVVERCGPADTVEYVIDFYQGRNDGGGGGGIGGAGAGAGGRGLSFFLDVRPKLNSWEGCKMRALSWLGW